ncbi:MAG: TonB-dependent receptor, partial [Candidatus Eremiobacteraeota bacterium]|nr:TonB-dependent receptor [Candidatus Eremiobacteraeota bacterium]
MLRSRVAPWLAALAGVPALVFVSLWASPAAAQDTGSITIVVTDAATHNPVGLARVLLDGAVLTSELSQPDGTVHFTDVPSGIYRARIIKNGYESVTSAQFEVLDGRAVLVAVALAKPAVKSLGTVTVRSSAVISSTSVSANSAVRKLSSTLTDALGKLSGVSIGTDPSGDADAQVTVSLEGHDASQTGLTLDGVPLNAPGVAGDLRSINTDLFSGSSINYGPSAGSLGGTVGFTSVSPTLTWQGTLTGSYGTFGNAAGVLSLSGTTGSVGLALTQASRGTYSALNGLTYLDASGLTYTHDGANDTGGTLFKIRTPLGSAQTITATYVSTEGYTGLICNRYTGPVPCGYGPNNYADRHLDFATLTDSALAGAVAIQFSLFDTDSTYNRDLLDRYVAGIPSPYGTLTDT